MLRYASPDFDEGPFDLELAEKWAPVDQYTGGAEHAVMHLLYARFFIKVLRDLGLVKFNEPFVRLFNQGTIIADGAKMSKSRGNVITPDPYVEQFGADVVRTYLMFLGPWEQGGEWSDGGINGVARWMNRVWELCSRQPVASSGESQAMRDLRRKLHQTLRKVHNDLDRFKFNTAIAAMMELSNAMSQAWSEESVDQKTWNECVEKLLLMLASFAPHVTEELWEKTGHAYSIHQQAFPEWDEELAAEEEITLVVQVNGRLRDKIQVPADISEDEAKRLAMESERVRTHVGDKEVRRVVYVVGRLVNVVIGK
jgi:leucyl-tRNA synthetase